MQMVKNGFIQFKNFVESVNLEMLFLLGKLFS